MAETYLHQIYYSAETKTALDPGFIGLDNTANERPDWREYWPIRTFLRTTPLREGAFYGFFSPKFKAKTGLGSESVLEFVRRHGESADVVAFSPFFDQMAYPLNIFEQGAMQHGGTMATFRESALAIATGIDLDALVMDSTNTVFCNFFAARPAFWRKWLENCERIFAIAEKGGSARADRLNADTSHDGRGVPAKVFVIERVASLMLSTQDHWKTKVCNPLSLPWSGSPLGRFRLDLTFMDALKIAYRSQGHPQYLAAFHELRKLVDQALQDPQP